MVNKTVIRLDLKGCDNCQKIAFQSVAKIEGVHSISIEMEDCTLTVIGEADPAFVAKKLRKKLQGVEIVSVEPMSSLPQEEKPTKPTTTPVVPKAKPWKPEPLPPPMSPERIVGEEEEEEAEAKEWEGEEEEEAEEEAKDWEPEEEEEAEAKEYIDLQKTVIRLDLKGCDNCQKIAFQSVAKIEGVHSLSIDMKYCTLTVIGKADPAFVAKKLRKKLQGVEIVSVEPMSSLPQEEKPTKPTTTPVAPKAKPWKPEPLPPPMSPERIVGEEAEAEGEGEAKAEPEGKEAEEWKPEPPPEGGKDGGSASDDEKTNVSPPEQPSERHPA